MKIFGVINIFEWMKEPNFVGGSKGEILGLMNVKLNY